MAAIILRRNGFYLDGKKIANRIEFIARGTVRPTGTAMHLLRFYDCDDQTQEIWINADQCLDHNLKKLADALANRGFDWPTGYPPRDLLRLVFANSPSRRVILVSAPGWYDGVYVTKARAFGSGKAELQLLETSEAKVADLDLGSGSLADWQKLLRRVRKSSHLCLALGATFGAPLLRPLNVGTFGIHIYGSSSQGKTTALKLAASSVGLRDLATMADSSQALEEMAVGHRDSVLLLDETSDGNRSDKELAQLVRAQSFGLARNRPRHKATRYENSGSPAREDFRIIVLATGERALSQVGKRLPGEAVRFIDMAVGANGGSGIFDGDLSSHGAAGQWTKSAVEYIEKYGRKYCGHAFNIYLEQLLSDGRGLSLAAKWAKQFEASYSEHSSIERRLVKNFAVIYSGLRLAARYQILPWSKQFIRRQMRRSTDLAITELRRSMATFDSAYTVRTLALQIKTLTIEKIVPGIRASSVEAERRSNADALLVKDELCIASKRITLTGNYPWVRKSETRKFSGIPGRKRYTVIDLNMAPADIAVACRHGRDQI